MSIIEVRALPLRASRHLAAWIVWHAIRVSLIEDGSPPAPAGGTERTGSRQAA